MGDQQRCIQNEDTRDDDCVDLTRMPLFVEETRETWSGILGRPVDEEEAKEIIRNMTALAELIIEFDQSVRECESDG